MRASSLRIIVTGLIGQHPRLGGVTWDYLQYPLGLARLGHDVYYMEDSGEWPYPLRVEEAGGEWVQRDPAPNVAHLRSVMECFGLGDRWAYRFAIDGRWFGMPDARREEIFRTADLLINVSGTVRAPEMFSHVPVRAYIDSDPGFTQIHWLNVSPQHRGQIDTHTVHFSFGESPSDDSPRTPHTWLPTRQPVVLDLWRRSERPAGSAYTTVMSWTSYKPLVFEGQSFGQKDAEFLRFLDLPKRAAPIALEVAMLTNAHDKWITPPEFLPAELRSLAEASRKSPTELLLDHGWRVTDSATVCGDPDAYRDYILDSRGEWSVAKNGYVRSRSGWFSCRSACYLAAGRPVAVQDTGFRNVLPTGEGLFAFSTIEEATEALQEIEADYNRHCRAARELAEEFFDSGGVLNRLIEIASAPPQPAKTIL